MARSLVPPPMSTMKLPAGLRQSAKLPEPISALALNVDLGGSPQEFVFYDVDVGQIVAREQRVNPAAFGAEGSVTISHSAAIRDFEDARPANNALQSILRLSETQ